MIIDLAERTETGQQKRMQQLFSDATIKYIRFVVARRVAVQLPHDKRLATNGDSLKFTDSVAQRQFLKNQRLE